MGGDSTADCQAGPDNEFAFVWFFYLRPSAKLAPIFWSQIMFAFNRSAAAVLLPLAMLVAVVVFSNRSNDPAPQADTHAAQQDQPVVANLPSR
jgi:hypothetical protein